MEFVAIHEIDCLFDQQQGPDFRDDAVNARFRPLPGFGQHFDGIVTGNSASETWVRIFTPPAEGKLVAGVPDLEVGQPLRVKLVSTNVERGFIDFVLAR
jgi:hypothetical protein